MVNIILHFEISEVRGSKINYLYYEPRDGVFWLLFLTISGNFILYWGDYLIIVWAFGILPYEEWWEIIEWFITGLFCIKIWGVSGRTTNIFA